MTRFVGFAACALMVLLAVSGVSAQQVVTGTVVRIDQPAGVVVLDNGQMYRTTPQTVYLVNNRPMTFATLRPGTPVVVQYAEPVVYREGRYVVMAPAGTVTTAPAAPVLAPGVVMPSAGIYEVSGVVRWVGGSDPGRQSITFDDGRQVWLDENTQLLAGGAPAMVSTLRPGTFVVVRSSKPFAFRNNAYHTTTAPVAVAPGAPVATAPVVTAPAAPTVVVPAPAPTAVTLPNGALSGTVVRIDQPNTIVLSDGRMIPATAQTVVMINDRAVPLSTVRPGSQVVIYPNGQAVSTDQYAPYAMPGPVYPEMGIRERELERNAP